MIKLKDIHRESAPQNKTQTLKQNMKIDIWEVSTLNQLLRDSYTEIKFLKKINLLVTKLHFLR